jgi:2-phosphosulfolactate phosphatase
VTDPAHRQASYPVRFEWGPTGAAAIGADAEIAVVVDVLSFTTTLTVAVERGMTVFPYGWKDCRAQGYAAKRDAVLAVGRLEGREGVGGVSLSPAAMAAVEGVERVVLPSPNGSSICFGLADSGRTVVGACLRNRAAVARWLTPRLAAGDRVAVVAAGERWPDGSLRPAVEDLWGAGAVLAALDPALVGPAASPEARHAALAFEAVRRHLDDELPACASGVELVGAGFRDDVRIAGELDASDAVPVLVGGAFAAV